MSNFLGVAGGAAAGIGISQLPAHRPGAGDERERSGMRPEQLPMRPEQRPNWGEWSQNRGDQWRERVDDRHDSWTHWRDQNQQRLNNFQDNRQQRWDHLETAREDRQNWRNQNREDWQQHRKDMWDYRFDRADEVWDNVRDLHDDLFDDRWWGACGWWGHGHWHGFGHYPANPWWWWRPCAWGALSSWMWASTSYVPAPIYADYGMNVIYEDEVDTVYVNDQPLPEAEYTGPMIDSATAAEPAPPPVPPEEGTPEEWMPLGVFALVQEEKGNVYMFFQFSVNREGVITGGYENVMTNDQRQITGQVDKTSQIAAWRIGENRNTICTTNLANFTEDVSTVTLHYVNMNRTETWLLVRLHEPPKPGEPVKLPELNRTPPPITPPAAQPK